MVIVTNGTVEYRHAVPKGDYNNVTPVVSLSFTVAEGSDPAAATNRIMAIAQDIVERAIAGKISVEQAAEQKTAKGTVSGRTTSKTPNVEEVERVENPMTGSSAPVAETNPASIVEEPDDEAVLGITPTVETASEKLISDVDLQLETKKISDKLRQQVGHIKDLSKLIAASQSEGTTNGTLTTIPQEGRSKYLMMARALIS